MAGLLDFLQSASNSAASNVSAPVDAIAWLLRKAGIPVQEPVGGSEWMQRQGLTRPVQQSGASVAGETLGLLSPMVAAAKAPQIAKGLLQMGENAAAPRTLNPQTGAIVWHGSPHKFDKFDSSKIGTGEGAQAYGHGMYFAESPDVAKEYQAALSAPSVRVGDRLAQPKSGTPADTALAWMQDAQAQGEDPFKWASSGLRLARDMATDANKQHFEQALRVIGYWQKTGAKPEVGGSLYKVDLPDDKIARMLDWDKPLSQQAPEVQKQIASASRKSNSFVNGRDITKLPQAVQDAYWKRIYPDGELPGGGGMTGNEFYNSLKINGAGSKGAANLLKEFGIPGIRYLDGGSRSAGTGTYNYVVFPGEENILKILERNGQGL